MRRTLLGAIAAVALVLTAGVALAQDDTTNDDAMLNSYLGVTVYPGSVLVSQNTETEFRSSASLQEVYQFIHDQLGELEWQRSALTENDVEIEARYTRGEEDLSIDLEREGEDRYDLEIEFDD